MTAAIFWLTQLTNQSQLKANLFCISHLISIDRLGLGAKSEPLECSGFSAAPTHIRLAAIIVIIQTIRLFPVGKSCPYVTSMREF